MEPDPQDLLKSLLSGWSKARDNTAAEIGMSALPGVGTAMDIEDLLTAARDRNVPGALMAGGMLAMPGFLQAPAKAAIKGIGAGGRALARGITRGSNRAARASGDLAQDLLGVGAIRSRRTGKPHLPLGSPDVVLDTKIPLEIPLPKTRARKPPQKQDPLLSEILDAAETQDVHATHALIKSLRDEGANIARQTEEARNLYRDKLLKEYGSYENIPSYSRRALEMDIPAWMDRYSKPEDGIYWLNKFRKFAKEPPVEHPFYTPVDSRGY